jgi:hypothetical protein
MKMKILAIGLVLLLASGGFSFIGSAVKVNINNNSDLIKSNSSIVKADNVLFREDFDNYNNVGPYWRVITQFSSFSIHDGMADLTIWKAWRFMYSNCEIRSPHLYKFNNLKIKIEVNNSWSQAGKEDKIQKGTVGWGFWNHKFRGDEISYAWFFHVKGSRFYNKNGLWAICKAPSTNGNDKGGFTKIRIEGYDITDWHEYGINWTEDSIDFYIDGKNVAHITKGVSQSNMTIHTWIDNAEWHGFFNGNIYLPVFMRSRRHNILLVDYFEVTE